MSPRILSALAATFFFSSIFSPASADTLHQRIPTRRHDVVARHQNPQAQSNATSTDAELVKRGGDRFTYYEAGLGACGGHNSGSDFIVAINSHQWDGGSHCGESVTISYQGKSTQATVVDKCMECPFGALDFSKGLFEFFARPAEVVGTIYGDWSFGSGGGGSNDDDDKKKDEPTSTSTKKAAPKTTTHTTTSSSSTKTSSTTTSTSSVATTSSSAAPSSSAVPFNEDAPMGTLQMFQLAMLRFGGVIVAAGTAQ